MQRSTEKLRERQPHQVGGAKIRPPRAFPKLGYERGRNIAEDSRQDPLPNDEIATQSLVRLCGDRYPLLTRTLDKVRTEMSLHVLAITSSE